MKRTLIGTLLMMTVFVAGCGDDGGGDDDSSSENTPTVVDESPVDEPVEEPAEDPTEDPADLPESTVEDWTTFITEAGGTNGVDYARDQLTDAIACLPKDVAPTCSLAAMSSQFFAQELDKKFSGALGEGDALSSTEPIGPPPSEIAELVTRTRDAAAAYNEAVRAITGVTGGEDCTASAAGTCADARATGKETGQELLDALTEWEPHLA